MKAALYKGDFSEELELFSVFKVRIIPKARTATIPLENGQAAFDNMVIDPTEVSVTCKICRFDKNGNETTTESVNSLVDKSSFYSVRDGMGEAMSGLVLKSAPYTRDPAEFDIAVVEFIFERPIIVEDGPSSQNKDNSNFISGGYVHGVLS